MGTVDDNLRVLIEAVTEGHLREHLRRRRMEHDIARLRDGGAAVLWVIEEHPRICLPAVDRVHFMSDGSLAPAVRAEDLLAEGALEELFFGMAS